MKQENQLESLNTLCGEMKQLREQLRILTRKARENGKFASCENHCMMDLECICTALGMETWYSNIVNS